MSRKSGPAALQPSLPKSLLAQIDESGANNDIGRKKGKGYKVPRKEARKQERLDRKTRKAKFFSAAPNINHGKRSADDVPAESPQKKKAKTGDREPQSLKDKNPPASSAVSGKITGKPLKTNAPVKNSTTKQKPKSKVKDKTTLEGLVSRSVKKSVASSSRSQREKEDDSYIMYLESKLGYAGGKGKKKADDDDGLDDLLNFTTSIVPTVQQNAEMDSAAGSESDDSNDATEDDTGDEDVGSEWGGIEMSNGGLGRRGDGTQEMDGVDDDEAPTLLPAPAEPDGVITTPSSRYIPPHLRNRAEVNRTDSEETMKLTRQLKGLLNRMSEQNMSSILDSIEELYRKHRRNDITSTLTTLIIDGISSHSILLDSYVVLHAAFISSLHKIIGIEFAAYFVQNVISSYETQRSALDATDPLVSGEVETLGKECSNLIVLISELYNFQVISSLLLFDIIRDLLDKRLNEFNIELLLKVVRNSGQQLRQDDPSALKDIISIVQTKLSDQDDKMSSRTRFMIETLTNLKNNKAKRTAGQQHQGGEAVERMKKFLSGLSNKRHVLAHEPLRVSLEDLHNAESKGKWWLVGAAWGGDPLIDRQETNKAEAKTSVGDISSNVLLKLARKQGMNTDIRRSIFVVLMSSDDYVDACERLSQLNLTELQQRDIIRVLLHCCGNEKTYNPYYTLIGQQLCRTSHSYKITLQFCLWDFLRDLGETTVGGAEVIKNFKEDDGFELKSISGTRMNNIAKSYGWWVAKDCCSLAILKPIDFTLVKPRTSAFLKDFLMHLFTATQVSAPIIGNILPTTRNRGALEEVFIKATRIEALALGLIYFLSKEMSRSNIDDLVKWASRVAVDTLRTGMDIIPNI